MIIEVYLEEILLGLKAILEDDEQEIKMRLHEDPNIECRLEPEILLTAHIAGKYELEG